MGAITINLVYKKSYFNKSEKGYYMDNILDKVKRNDESFLDINCNADMYIINTPYHLLLTSFLKKDNDIIILNSSLNIDKKGFIRLILDTKFKKNLIITIKSLKKYNRNVFMIYRLLKSQTNRIISETKNIKLSNIIMFNDVIPINQNIINEIKCEDHVIIVEEGIGLYRDMKKQLNFIYSLFGKILFGIHFQNVKRIGEYKKTTKIICNYPKLLSDKQKVKTIENFKTIDFKKIGEELGIYTFRKCNWFIGQPLVEDNVLEEKIYLAILEKIIKKISSDENKLIIKPHPREDVKKYKYLEKKYSLEIYKDKDIPIELLIQNDSTVKIYTAFSSAALNLSSQFSCNVFMLFDLFEIDPNIPDVILKSLPIKILSSWDELIQINKEEIL